MIRLIEALNYRCLRYIQQPVADFQILVGPNASGKTTFLDVVAFLGDLLEKGLDEAIHERTTDFTHLLFAGDGNRFELAVEMGIPDQRRRLMGEQSHYETIRYEVAIAWVRDLQEIHVFDEQVILQSTPSRSSRTRPLFPQSLVPPNTILRPRTIRGGGKRVLRKVYNGNDNILLRTATNSRQWALGAVVSAGAQKVGLGQYAGR